MKRGSESAQAEGDKEGQSSNNYFSEEENQSEPTKITATEDRKLDGGARPGGKSNKPEALVTAPTAHYPPSVTPTLITQKNGHEVKPKEMTAVAPERQERPTTQAGDEGTMQRYNPERDRAAAARKGKAAAHTRIFQASYGAGTDGDNSGGPQDFQQTFNETTKNNEET
ncbi:hypothetical protein DVH05_001496 [Phytophthora capsici]|nr:hypothetical protein DVH05_001496 [Phytophthora capsici]